MTSKYGKNEKVAHKAIAKCVTDVPHFDVICDLLLNRCTATWNLLDCLIIKNIIKKQNIFMVSSICTYVLQQIMSKNQPKGRIIQHIIHTLNSEYRILNS